MNQPFNNTDRAILWGLLGFIAYELWKPSGLAALPQPSPGAVSISTLSPGESVASPWMQQLSGGLTWYSEDGTINQNVDFFTPRRGMFGRCY